MPLTRISRRFFTYGIVLVLAACTIGASDGLISPSDLATALKQKDFLLVDVRTPGEHRQGVIPGTDMLFPYDRIPSLWRTKNIPLDKKIIVYCHSGNRSARAARALRELGYTNVRDLDGGISGWIRAGYKIVPPEH